MLWGFLSRTNVDYAELLREEFIQGIQVFFACRDSNKDPSKKPTPHVIPYCRFTNMIIYFLGSKFNIHRRPESPRHVTGNDFLLGNLKFVPKGEKDGVFGMPIPKELITEAIQKSEYYKQYVEMAARKVQAKVGGKKKTAPKADKPVKPTPAKLPNSKPSGFQLVDEEEQAEHEPKPETQGEGEEYDIERAIQMSLESFQATCQVPIGGVAIREPVSEATQQLPMVEGKGKAISNDEQAAQSLPSTQPEDDTSANIVCDTSSPTDAETVAETGNTNSEGDIEILNIGEEQGKDVTTK
ncbi:hypothetical protein Tco_1342917, partial [Tanacetum coccineum]